MCFLPVMAGLVYLFGLLGCTIQLDRTEHSILGVSPDTLPPPGTSTAYGLLGLRDRYSSPLVVSQVPSCLVLNQPINQLPTPS